LALLLLLNCGESQHDVKEKYFLVSANVKVPYWQEAAAGLKRAAGQMHVQAEFVGPDSYDPNSAHAVFQEVLKQKPTGILVSASAPSVLNEDINSAIDQGTLVQVRMRYDIVCIPPCQCSRLGSGSERRVP
jgi:ABC-type sugar transport system substrate-binding protein